MDKMVEIQRDTKVSVFSAASLMVKLGIVAELTFIYMVLDTIFSPMGATDYMNQQVTDVGNSSPK